MEKIISDTKSSFGKLPALRKDINEMAETPMFKSNAAGRISAGANPYNASKTKCLLAPP
jgi:hypothetical protein